MAVKIDFADNKVMFNFKALPKLEFKEDKQNGFIKYGANNLYPQELVRLYNEHPEHRAIVNRKARYIWGKGVKAVNKEDEIKVNNFIETFNRFEDLNQVGKKLAPNTELFNGCFIEVITNLAGEPLEYYFLNSANCRLSEDKKTLYFCKNWTKTTRLSDVKVITQYNKGVQAGTYFLEFSYYNPSASYIENIYPTPQYQSAVGDINTDIDISTANSVMVNNGLSMGKILVFHNGSPDDSQKNRLDRNFKGTYSGEQGESVMILHMDREDKPPELIDITPSDMAERFAFTSKRAQKKIFVAHEMSPELFNIKFDDGFLSTSADLLILEELHVKGYIEPRQLDLLNFLSYLAFLKTGEYLEMMFEPISLIGADLSNDVDLTQDERRKLKGYEPLKPLPVDANGEVIPLEASQVNDALVGLSATERNDINRIVHQFKTKKNGTSEALAIASLGAYGFSVSDAKKFLGINEGLDAKMSNDKEDKMNKILLAFDNCGTIEDPTTYTVLKREKVRFKNTTDALKYERQIMKFADALTITVTQLDSAVLNALKGNPTLTIDELAYTLNSNGLQISESIARLTKKGFLDANFLPTEKAIEKETEPIISKEIYTVYKYEVNDEKPPLQPGGKSRTFCTKLLAKNKEYTFEQIDNMTNEFDTDVWSFRGGFYNNKGIIDPDCRHIWVAETRSRDKK
jgi:hypothetical protein